MISEEIPFNPSNSLSVFAYEGFQYTISNPDLTYTLQTVGNVTGGLTPTLLYFTKVDNSGYVFAVSDASSTLTPSTRPESFILTTVSGSVVLSSSNTVTINGGRFLDGSGNSLSNNSYVFYKNEPISPITLVAPFTLNTPPTSGPALPPGLSFVRDSSSIFRISGTPTVTVPNSNYQIVGKDQAKGKIITTKFNMVVSNERLRLNLSGSSIVNNMEIGTDISSRVITAIPSAGSTTVRYTFPAFPDGIVVTDVSGTVKSSPFAPTDPSYTLILSGAPTSNAAYAFSRIVSGTPTYTVQAARTVPLPIVENSQAFSFGFAPTILFDQSTVPQLYTNIAFDQSSIFFRAQTYFTTGTTITDIFSPDLRSDLSLVFVPSQSRAYLKGNPIQSSPGSATYTISAIDSAFNTRTYPVVISVVDDSVSFSSPVGDVCVNYILSRPTNNFKTGYYTSPVQFTANAASGRSVSFSAPLLTGTGLSLSNGLLTGIPSAVTPLTDLVVTATVAGSPATATKTIKFAILDDSFNFTDVCTNDLNFIQNVPITPFRFPVSTLSERSIINYSQTGFPDGLSINPAGFVSGTPLSSSPTAGNVTINASTGYATGSRDFSYNLIPDSMIFVVPQTSYAYQAGNPVGTIDINGVTFSGTTVSNYDLSISPTYGLTVNPSNGILSGTWSTGIPPAAVLPSSCNFAVNAQAGGLNGTLPMSFTADPVVVNASVFVAYGNPPSSSSFQSWMYYNTTTDVSSFLHVVDASASQSFMDIQFKNNDPTNNTILGLVTMGSPGYIFKGTRLNDLSAIPIGSGSIGSQFLPQMSALAFGSGTNVYTAGTISNSGSYSPVVVTSSNLGDLFDFSNARIISGIQSRDFNRTVTPVSPLYDPYIRAGIALAYDSNSNIMLAGGSSNSSSTDVMVRSTNEGSNWTACVNGFTKEVAYFNIDNSSLWIATGSSGYRTTSYVTGGFPAGFSSTATTIKYSTNQGSNWYDAAGGFNMFGYEIAYANGTWLATGTSAIPSDIYPGQYAYVPELRYSTNGVNWIAVDFPASVFDQEAGPTKPNTYVSNAVAPLRIGSLNFDGTYWNVFVNEELPDNGIIKLYRHDAISELETGWFAVDLSGSFTAGEPQVSSNTRILSMRNSKYLYTGAPPTNIQLSINTNIGNGPTFTSPTTNSFLLYQYMQITPIQISATGSGQVYLFVETADLPPGLSYSRVTNQITGAPARIGNDSVTFYAQDNTGIRQFVLNFTTIVPRVIRKQDGAGAYTSLLRQYTEVLGAQNARDNRVLPNQERALGEFMSPEAPDVVTQTVDQKCFDPTCLR